MGLEGQKPRKKTQESGAPEMTRRGFLKGLGAVAATAALGSDTLQKVIEQKLATRGDRLDRVERLMSKIKNAQDRFFAPDVSAAVEGQGEYPLERALRAAQLNNVDPSDLEGTMYDVSKLHEQSVQIQHRRDMKPSLASSLGAHLAAADGGYSNGVYWENEETILTAAHVHDSLAHRPLRQPDQWDIGTIRVGSDHRGEARNVVRDEPTLSNRDIHGALVAIVGIDPDSTADPSTGRKTWLGLGIDLSRGLSSAEQFKDLPTGPLEASFGVVLPPNEAKLSVTAQPDGSIRREQAPAAGMSGAAMYAWVKGRWVFAGIFWAANQFDDTEKHTCLDLGFVHGIDDVRRGIAAGRSAEIT